MRLAQFHQSLPESDMRLGRRRAQLESLAKQGSGLIEVSILAMGQAKAVVGLEEVAPQIDRACQRRDCPPRGAVPHQGHAKVVVGFRPVSGRLCKLLEYRHCLVKLAFAQPLATERHLHVRGGVGELGLGQSLHLPLLLPGRLDLPGSPQHAGQ